MNGRVPAYDTDLEKKEIGRMENSPETSRQMEKHNSISTNFVCTETEYETQNIWTLNG